MSVGVFLRVDKGVILIGDAMQANQCPALAQIKGCQVRDRLWGNEELDFHEFYIAHV